MLYKLNIVTLAGSDTNTNIDLPTKVAALTTCKKLLHFHKLMIATALYTIYMIVYRLC